MTPRTNKVGAVLVIGGGIAGIQASLDLVELGFQVHVVEESPTLGEIPDRTVSPSYPCILAPRLHEIGSNPSIEMLTGAVVLEIRGEPGRMEARVRKSRDEEIKIETGAVILAARGPLVPSSALGRLADSIGLHLNDKGFLKAPPLDPVATSRKGIYACGPVSGPAAFPRALTEASAAACRAAADLVEARFSLIGREQTRDLPDRSAEPPRVGVFVCDHGCSRTEGVHGAELVEYASGLPFVVHARSHSFACASDGQVGMKLEIQRRNLNHVVVFCSFEDALGSMFGRTLVQAGLEPSLLQLASPNGKDPHRGSRGTAGAAQSAREIVQTSVLRAAYYQPRNAVVEGVVNSALVVGGNLPGIVAALAIAGQGYQVHLVEKTAGLGSDLKQGGTAGTEKEKTGSLAGGLIERVSTENRITVHLNSEVMDFCGYLGNFTTRVNTPGGMLSIPHGAAILTGDIREAWSCREGFFVAGTNEHGGSAEESVLEAEAAAARAAALLAKDRVTVYGLAPAVSRGKCAACLTCVRTCPCGVPYITDKGHAEIEPAICKGCGTCIAECPGKAISLQQFSAEQMRAKLEMMLCGSCGRPYVTLARLEYLKRRLSPADLQLLDRRLCPDCARRKGAGDHAGMTETGEQ